jgi:hypothetical protein
MKSFEAQTSIHVSLSAFSAVEQVNGDKRTMLYRVAQEALTNIARHAQASRADVKIQKLDDAICMEIRRRRQRLSGGARAAGQEEPAIGAARDEREGADGPRQLRRPIRSGQKHLNPGCRFRSPKMGAKRFCQRRRYGTVWLKTHHRLATDWRSLLGCNCSGAERGCPQPQQPRIAERSPK